MLSAFLAASVVASPFPFALAAPSLAPPAASPSSGTTLLSRSVPHSPANFRIDEVFPRLKAELDAAARGFRGRVGYCVIDVATGRSIDLNGDDRFPSASTIKTALMVEAVNQVDEGKLNWTDKKPVPPTGSREASMWSFYFKDGTTLDLNGWVTLNMTVSDNTATIVLRDWLTQDAVNARMEKLGLRNTLILRSGVSDQRLARLREMFGLGVTTPREMARLLQLILEGKAASRAGCDRMLRIMSQQYWDDWIGASVPPDVRVASKSGAISRSRSDTAIVFGDRPYILTIYTDGQQDRRWSADNEGDRLLVRLARIVWARMNPHRPYTPPDGFEKFAPTGSGL
ncbi:MAG: serine hydrolase [Fimbriimonadaceae bacterium]